MWIQSFVKLSNSGAQTVCKRSYWQVSYTLWTVMNINVKIFSFLRRIKSLDRSLPGAWDISQKQLDQEPVRNTQKWKHCTNRETVDTLDTLSTNAQEGGPSCVIPFQKFLTLLKDWMGVFPPRRCTGLHCDGWKREQQLILRYKCDNDLASCTSFDSAPALMHPQNCIPTTAVHGLKMLIIILVYLSVFY